MSKEFFLSLTNTPKSPLRHTEFSRIIQRYPVANIKLNTDRIFFVFYPNQICLRHPIIALNMTAKSNRSNVSDCLNILRFFYTLLAHNYCVGITIKNSIQIIINFFINGQNHIFCILRLI